MKKLYLLILILFIGLEGFGQERTVGLTYYEPEVSEGYTLITSHHSTSTYLIDNCGNVVHEWTSDYFYGNSVDLLSNGLLLRSTKVDTPYYIAGGAGGRVELLDWNSNIVWEMTYATDAYRHHHDALYLPNGNILILAWDGRNEAEALQAGLNPEYLGRFLNDIWGEHILEVKPIGNNDYEIVWEWYLWDHIIQDFDDTKDNFGVVEDHPELVDLNYNVDPGNPDWIHANALAYNEELDQVILGTRNFNEFWVIDHSTTTEEARGHTGGNVGMGGDIIYRYGNPAVYRRGTEEDQKFYDPHNPHWIDNNKILVFNNGNRRVPPFSEIFFMETPVQTDGSYALSTGEAYGPAAPYLTYSSDDIAGFNYSTFISGVELLDNGNLLICSGASGTISEVTPDGRTLWTYVNPLSSEGTLEQGSTLLEDPQVRNLTYRARKYPRDYAGLAGRILLPGDPIELNPLPSICEEIVSAEEDLTINIRIYPNPVQDNLFINIPDGMVIVSMKIRDMNGRVLKEVVPIAGQSSIQTDQLSPGLYFLEVSNADGIGNIRFMKD